MIPTILSMEILDPSPHVCKLPRIQCTISLCPSRAVKSPIHMMPAEEENSADTWVCPGDEIVNLMFGSGKWLNNLFIWMLRNFQCPELGMRLGFDKDSYTLLDSQHILNDLTTTCNMTLSVQWLTPSSHRLNLCRIPMTHQTILQKHPHPQAMSKFLFTTCA